MTELQSYFPKAQIALKTDPLWNQTYNRFGRVKVVRDLGIRFLNIIRLLAFERDLPLFDFHRIFEGLSPEYYLFDDIHLKPHFSLICFRILFGFLLANKTENRHC